MINQLIRVFEELTYDKKKENIHIVCSSHLGLLLEQNSTSKVFDKRKGSIIIDHELKELDFIICKQSEVILSYLGADIDPDKLINLTKISKKLRNNTNDLRIKKTKNKPKDYPTTLDSEEIIKYSNKENEISIKRKSYRQKVKDFKTNKLKTEDTTKIQKNNKNLEIIKKQDNQEKKQGWWTQ